MISNERRKGAIASPRVRGLAIGFSISILTFWGAAHAETPDIGIDLSKAQPIFDNQLDTMRGKFLPGNIEAFSLSLSSSVEGNGVTDTAGVELGVNVKNGRPQVTTDQSFSSETAGSGIPAAPAGTASGGNTLSANLTGGFGQIVQVVGSGNSALNDAVVNISSSPLAVLPSPTTEGAPCTTCTVTEGKKGIDITVDDPGVGDADQMIGSGLISQGITINSNDAAAINSLSLQIQMAPGANNNLAGLGTIVNSIPEFIH
jgi:hypothetical protein